MAQANTKRETPKTHEGAPAQAGNAYEQLRRAVSACLLWEDTFYESGEDIATRIHTLAGMCTAEQVIGLAGEAKHSHKLRHVPMWLALNVLSRPDVPGETKRALVNSLVVRADEMAEFITLYWASQYHNGKEGVVPNAMRKGLADAFSKFDEYQFGKYKGKGKQVPLRDAFMLVHPETKDKERWRLYQKIKNDELAIPETWETKLAAGGDKKTVFTELLMEGRLGYLACLRNLRGMKEVGVDETLIFDRLRNPAGRGNILPFQFMSAADHNPWAEPVIEEAMLAVLKQMPKMPGKTAILVDTSGSMHSPVSGRSQISHVDAASGMAIMLRELCEHAVVIAWSSSQLEVPARRGFALRESIKRADVGMATYGDEAVEYTLRRHGDVDRIIMCTDMQLHTRLRPWTQVERKYLINTNCYQNGVGYGHWNWIDGFSPATLRYVQEYEALSH